VSVRLLAGALAAIRQPTERAHEQERETRGDTHRRQEGWRSLAERSMKRTEKVKAVSRTH
jgi:hypothetical protein